MQLHGGLGVTDECAVGHVLERVVVLEGEFGAGPQLLAAFAGGGGFIAAAA